MSSEAAAFAPDGGGRTGGLSPLMLAGAFAVALAGGIALGYAPLLPFAAIAAIGYLWLCAARPYWALLACIVVLVALPVYVRIPPVGPLPPLPIAPLMMAALAILSAFRFPRPAWLGPERLFVRLLIVFGFVALTSLINEATTAEGWNMWLKACLFPYMLLLFVMVRVIDRPEQADGALLAMLFGGCLVAAYGVWEFIVGHNRLLEELLAPLDPELATQYADVVRHGQQYYRSFSTFSNPLEYGTLLSMVTPYAVIRFGAARSWPERLLFAAAAGLCLLGIVVTFSRGCLLAVMLVTLLIGISRAAYRRWLFAGAVVLMTTASIGWLVVSTTGQELITAKIEDRLSDIDNVTLRIKLWETAAVIFLENPLRGVGIGNFPQYQIAAIRKNQIGPVDQFGENTPERVRVAEQTYLQLAAETGLIGAGICAAALVLFFWLLFQVIRNAADETEWGVGMGALAGSIGYMISGMTITAYTHFQTTMLLVGMFFACALIMHRSQRQRGEV